MLKRPPKETIGKTFAVAFVVAVLCGIVVSIASVMLRPNYLANLEGEQRETLLQLLDSQPGLMSFFDTEAAKRIEEVVVELESGRVIGTDELEELQEHAHGKLMEQTVLIPPAFDTADLHQRPRYLPVYVVGQENALEMVILPVYGKGYASTLKGYLAVNIRSETVAGLSFYEHGETPGLGARASGSEWLAQWQGKKIWDATGDVRVGVARSGLPADRPTAIYEVDAISGATVTSRGVHRLVRFWLGEHGFGPFLKKIRTVDRSVHLLRDART